MTAIIGFSGRKQSGKNTSCNFILGHIMVSLGIVKGGFSIMDGGHLHISDLFGDEAYDGILDINRNDPGMVKFRADYLDKYVKIYSFADILKKNVCMDIFGLNYEHVYGSDADKSVETHLFWQNMPGVISKDKFYEVLVGRAGLEFEFQEPPSEDICKELAENLGFYIHDDGPMTGRDVMQYMGTNIFRKIYSDVWVDALMRKIKAEEPGIALICDIRFPNEVAGIQKNGGLVIRLTKNGDNADTHFSETALDPNVFDWNLFNYVLDNSNKTIHDSNQEVYSVLNSIGLLEEEQEEVKKPTSPITQAKKSSKKGK